MSGELTRYGDVFSLRAFLAGNDFEGDILAFEQCATTFHVDCGVMYEYILAAFTCDEAEAFFFIEPFNDTGF